jgi:hypothetical protein
MQAPRYTYTDVTHAEWEGKVCTALVTFPRYLKMFKNAAGDLFDISTRTAKYRMDVEFAIIEELILDLHNESQELPF